MTLTRTTQTLRRRRPLRLGLVIGVLMLAAIAAGCGSSSAGLERRRDRRHDSFDDDVVRHRSIQDAAASDDPQQAALDWAACMRKNGIDVPDPEVGSDGRIRIGPGAGRGADDIDRETFQAAQKECGSPFGAGGGPQLSAAQREEMQATMLEFAACMRKNGVDMPDPDFSGGGGVFRVGGPGSGASILTTRPSARRRRPASRSCRTACPGRSGRPWSTDQRVRTS